MPVISVLLWCTSKKRGSYFLYSFIRTVILSVLSLLFSQLNKSTSFNLLYVSCSSPWPSFHPSLGYLQYIPDSLLTALDIAPRCVSPGLREKIISFDLMAMLCLMQPRRLLDVIAARTYCWLMVSLFTSTHRSFSVKLLFQQFRPQPVALHHFFSPQVQKFTFPFVRLHEVPAASFLQPAKVSVIASVLCTDGYTQSRVLHKVTENTLHPVTQLYKY